MASFWPEVGDVRPLVVGADFERRPCPRRGLLEDEGDVAPGHPLHLGVGVLLEAKRVGEVDQEEELVLREVDFF